MTRRIICALALCCMMLCMSAVYADTFIFQPSDKDLQDLPHANYFAWKIVFTVPQGQTIDNAVLSISSIENWTYEPNNNWLHMQLMDSKPGNGTQVSANLWSWNDEDGSGNAWANRGVPIATYTDNVGHPVNLSYDFKSLGLVSKLTTYDSDGVFYLGFDPDCHFYNSGVQFQITTGPQRIPVTPEPSALVTLGIGGISLLAQLTRKRKA